MYFFNFIQFYWKLFLNYFSTKKMKIDSNGFAYDNGMYRFGCFQHFFTTCEDFS